MWSIDHTQASLSVPGLSASVNLGRPDLGLADIAWQGAPVADARLLQVRRQRDDLVPPLVDAYVRGPGVIAVYESRLGGAVATQLDWRFVAHAALGVAGVELIVSVHTELLDDDPELSLVSELPYRELFQAAEGEGASLVRIAGLGFEPGASCRCRGAGLFAYRLAHAAGSYLEMFPPADFGYAEFEPGAAPGTLRSRWGLFGERLEKGVLRRTRVCGLLCSHTPTAEVTAACYRRWLDLGTPLST